MIVAVIPGDDEIVIMAFFSVRFAKQRINEMIQQFVVTFECNISWSNQ